MQKKKIIAILLVALVASVSLSWYFGVVKIGEANKKPIVEITYPYSGATVSKIVTISGTASDPDGPADSLEVEVTINGQSYVADGHAMWSYEWRVYDTDNGVYTVSVRSWDGTDYSDIKEIKVRVANPEIVESGSHKWAIFIEASNFPADKDSKLGNGALNLAEKMVDFFVGDLGYATSNIFILFDDGWIRTDNGLGEPIETLDQRPHHYDITYGKATKETVTASITYIVKEANNFDDSEVFIWIAGHGWGDVNKTLFGGKILQTSSIFLWGGEQLTDRDLGDTLSSLRSKKTCVMVDACYSGGFADKTIFNLPESFIFNSKIPRSGRVVISGTSKFRVGYASPTEGPLFSMIWFEGLRSGKADGFRPGIAHTGRPTFLKIFKDGKVSVEEAFYYARYTLRTDKSFSDYKKMQPQINDKYPRSGIIGSMKGLILGN